ncbi:MFS family permease [Friedmanniella endophytica]|uniref:MFS family permease n=1 Tax=Microlunatus kandeliicorticis TaxID=1759536 RepID=A0A7W3IPM1_9ACTN|nr:MFS family permease [Microlunatus kandeliicorticis]
MLPTFLSSTLHAGPGLLGVIESISDALTGLSKLAGGPLAADPRRRARLASSGYLGTAVATAAIGLTTAVWQVAVLRAVAWVSRGIRSPARDLVLTSLARSDRYGRAFGVERFGDNAGAVVGPLLAAGLVGVLGVRHTILLAIVPGLLAALAILIAAREARRNLGSPAARRGLGLNLAALRRAGVVRLLIPVAMFELGNVATTMLILRATDLLRVAGSGAPTRTLAAATSLAVLLYAGHNVAAALAALLAGRVADSTGRPRLVLGIGAALYLVGYGVFAVGPHGWPVLLGGFLMAGAGIGFAEPAESVLLARGLPEELRAHGFGLLGLVQALADLGSTAVVGALWAGVSAAVGFGYATGWMLLAVIGCLVVRTRFRSESPGSDGAADPDPAQ